MGRGPIAAWFDGEMQMRRKTYELDLRLSVVATRHSPASLLTRPCFTDISVNGQD
jgi:hypothetical protein